MNWIEVNGTSLRYEVSGGGPATLVLIHEMGGTLTVGIRCCRRSTTAVAWCATTRAVPVFRRRSTVRSAGTRWRTMLRRCSMRWRSGAASRWLGSRWVRRSRCISRCVTRTGRRHWCCTVLLSGLPRSAGRRHWTEPRRCRRAVCVRWSKPVWRRRIRLWCGTIRPFSRRSGRAGWATIRPVSPRSTACWPGSHRA